MNRLLVGVLGIAGAAFWLLTGANVRSAPQQPSPSVQYIEGNAYQKQRGYAPAVVTKGGRIVWLAGHNVTPDANGKIVGDFQAQAREAFALMDRTLKASGGSLQNLVTMTIFLKDPRYGDELLKVRREMFPDGKFPSSTLITISDFALPGILIEMQGVAVIAD
jgi:2-iminobutanoate/2-iminopropanoate deaminase